MHRAAVQVAAVGEQPAARAVLQVAQAEADARPGLRDAGRSAFGPAEVLGGEVGRPFGRGIAGGESQAGAGEEGEGGAAHGYIRSIIAWPKAEQLTCFAPCIWRAKS